MTANATSSLNRKIFVAKLHADHAHNQQLQSKLSQHIFVTKPWTPAPNQTVIEAKVAIEP